MCAINGATGSHEDVVARMNTHTRDRGPDGTAVWTNGRVTLGFDRLAIIDLSERSMQPMHRLSRYSLVFNGEIYNFRELKEELVGFHFESDGDAEVVIAAYAKWGTEAFSKLNGMFAFALYDHERDELVLARDPVGIKPLYYAVYEKELWFSSDTTALLEVVPRRVHKEALAHYIRLLYVPSPLTLIEGVQRVLPGEVLVYTKGALSHKQIKLPELKPFSGAYTDAVEAVRNMVQGAVTRQLVSDRPIGLFLSGGVDSSIVAAVASSVHPAINTYSVRFALENHGEDEKFNSDANRARESARKFGTTHHEFEISSQDAAGLFGTMVSKMHQPVANATALAQLYLSQKTKETATVVLTGDGGDELFGGYDRYQKSLWAEYASKLIPETIARLLPHPLSALHLRGVERYLQLMEQNDIVTGITVDTRKFFEEYFRNEKGVRALMRADEHMWLVDEALLRTDAMTMAASLEARVPLLDLEVRAVAHALPTKFLVSPFATKRILKDAFRPVLPQAIFNGPKRGWFSPGAKWLRTPEFIQLAERYFNDSRYASLINLDAVRALHAAHIEKRSYHYQPLWAVLVVLAWLDAHNISV